MNVKDLINALEEYPSTNTVDLTKILAVTPGAKKAFLIALDSPIIGMTCTDEEVLLVTEVIPERVPYASDQLVMEVVPLIMPFRSIPDLITQLRHLPPTLPVELTKRLPSKDDYTFRLDFPIIGLACNDIDVVFVVEHQPEIAAFGTPVAV